MERYFFSAYISKRSAHPPLKLLTVNWGTLDSLIWKFDHHQANSHRVINKKFGVEECWSYINGDPQTCCGLLCISHSTERAGLCLIHFSNKQLETAFPCSWYKLCNKIQQLLSLFGVTGLFLHYVIGHLGESSPRIFNTNIKLLEFTKAPGIIGMSRFQQLF